MSRTVQTENLDGLLRRIRQEGSERAAQEAEQILAVARQRAADLIQAAEAEAARITRDGEARLAQSATAGRVAQELAARDLVLAVRARLIAMLERVIERAGREVMTDAMLQELILKAAAAWLAGAAGRDIEVQLSEADHARLADGFLDRLKAELEVGIEFNVLPGIESGFRVGNQGGSMVYDFTVPAVAEALAALLRPQFAKWLDPLRQEGGNR